ncbi:MAG: hydroxymethylbilane synthase [Eubacteriales bacterium]|nr:hydroxymethylbilane synthase [Eubacteriales bacterium]
MKTIRIGSRESRLAMIQTQMVADYLTENVPGISVEIVPMKTTGDRILDRTLDQVGGKGLFVKELDQALLDGRSDLSVHSLKDVPMELPEQLPLLGFSKREDPRDALILPRGATEIDFSKPIGCSSKRRMLQLRELFPQAVFQPIRGNVQTRLRKLDEGQYSATILAVAGLKRLGLEERIHRIFSTEEMLPAAGQGVLAVQGRAGEDIAYLDGFFDAESRDLARCERAFVAALDGGCSAPTAAYAELTPDGKQIFLTGLYQEEATGRGIRRSRLGDRSTPEALGRALAEEIKRAEQ